MKMRSTIIGLSLLLFTISFASAAIPADCYPQGMIALLKLDGSTTESLGFMTDQSPPGGQSYTSVQVGNGVDFSTSPGHVELYDQPGAFFKSFTGSGSSKQFSMEFWMGSYTETGALDAIILNGAYIIKRGAYWITFYDISKGQYYANSTLDNTQNNHIAIRWSSSGSKKLEIYINGAYVNDTANVDFTNPSMTEGIIQVGQPNIDFTIDELAFYNLSLSTTKIGQHYQLGSIGKNYCETTGVDFSTIRSEFTVAGCQIPTGGSIAKNTCSRDGKWFCDASEELYFTDSQERGCSLGLASYTSGQPMCCGERKVCDPTTLVCKQADQECPQYNGNQDECRKAGCFWIGGTENKCVVSPGEYGCSVYETQLECQQDTYNVGPLGVGTESCEPFGNFHNLGALGQYVVPTSSCRCVWENNKCKLAWNFTESIYSLTVTQPNSYECRTVFEFGNCVDGTQTVRWNTTAVKGLPTGGVFDPLPGETDDARVFPGCVNGTLQRTCGEPVVKLPGVSTFSIILTISLLITFYLYGFKEEE